MNHLIKQKSVAASVPHWRTHTKLIPLLALVLYFFQEHVKSYIVIEVCTYVMHLSHNMRKWGNYISTYFILSDTFFCEFNAKASYNYTDDDFIICFLSALIFTSLPLFHWLVGFTSMSAVKTKRGKQMKKNREVGKCERKSKTWKEISSHVHETFLFFLFIIYPHTYLRLTFLRFYFFEESTKKEGKRLPTRTFINEDLKEHF